MRSSCDNAPKHAAVSPHLLVAAGWQRRLLDRERSRLLPTARQELRALLDCSAQLLRAIVNDFHIDPAGVVVLRSDRREVHSLLLQMQETSNAVQCAYLAGVEWGGIERITQRAWALACELFEAIGWDEAFGTHPDAAYAGSEGLGASRATAGNRLVRGVFGE